MELKVWVEGIQRIVCGVTETTTCQVFFFKLSGEIVNGIAFLEMLGFVKDVGRISIILTEPCTTSFLAILGDVGN